VAKLFVTVKLVAVIEATVAEAVTAKFVSIVFCAFKLKIVAEATVEVAKVEVEMEVIVKAEYSEPVTVAFVNVAFVPMNPSAFEVEALVVDELIVVKFEVPVAFKFVVFVVPPFNVAKLPVLAFEVVALVVDAFNVLKFPVVPKIVVNSPVTNDRKDPVTPVEVVVALTLKLVEVEFVIVPFATLIDGRDKLVTERLVMVAEVIVASVLFRLVMFPIVEFKVVKFPTSALVVVAFVVEALRVAIFAVVPFSVAIKAEVRLAKAE